MMKLMLLQPSLLFRLQLLRSDMRFLHFRLFLLLPHQC